MSRNWVLRTGLALRGFLTVSVGFHHLVQKKRLSTIGPECSDTLNVIEDEGRGVDFLLCGWDPIKNRSGVSVPPEQGRSKEETNSGSGDESEAWGGGLKVTRVQRRTAFVVVQVFLVWEMKPVRIFN